MPNADSTHELRAAEDKIISYLRALDPVFGTAHYARLEYHHRDRQGAG
jgi:hypothetical protein